MRDLEAMISLQRQARICDLGPAIIVVSAINALKKERTKERKERKEEVDATSELGVFSMC